MTVEILSSAGRARCGKPLIRCRCVCGKSFVTQKSHLVSGHTQSCGCAQREAVKKTNKQKRKHGCSGTVEYDAFRHAFSRCNNPRNKDYKDYGKRGIQFLFASVSDFVMEIGFRPGPTYSLDRIDNDGHYESGNVRWATPQEQMSNRRICV